jgi:hypothetical protein
MTCGSAAGSFTLFRCMKMIAPGARFGLLTTRLTVSYRARAGVRRLMVLPPRTRGNNSIESWHLSPL